MKIDTLADLLEAYKSGELSLDNRLMVDEEKGIVYIERNDVDNNKQEDSEANNEWEDYYFCLHIIQLIVEAMEILEIPIDN